MSTVVREQIPLSKVSIGAAEERAVLDVLRSGHIAQGPVVAQLEELFADMTGTRHAVAVSSGTTALIAALQALGIGPGDEVITAPLTFGATLNAILHVGATARFVDVRPDGTMDPDLLGLDLRRRYAAAVLPVHLYGLPCDMEGIAQVAAEAGSAIIEDAAQAVGASFDGRPVGSFGIGCFSLYATKNITTGEGGMLTTNDDRTAETLRLLRNQGMSDRYVYEIPGHNYRMTDVCAAIGVPQMQRLDQIVAARRANAAYLCDGLAGVPGLELPPEAPDRTHVFHHFTVRVTEEALVDRETLEERLAEAGIGAAAIYPNVVFDHACFSNHPRVVRRPVPMAEAMAREVLSLPVYPGLTAHELERIVTGVRSALGA